MCSFPIWYRLLGSRAPWLPAAGAGLDTDVVVPSVNICSGVETAPTPTPSIVAIASERAAELMQENIITDRTIIDVMAFCALSKSMSEAEKQHINGVLWHLIKEYDVIFHIDDLSVPIEDNGVRETDKNYRLDIHKKI